ncbi:MAG: MipA/OmpV family protein [Campylobacterota bacterium]|nr:MipA/OmpV family protein [Campylobacterota bacterium]
MKKIVLFLLLSIGLLRAENSLSIGAGPYIQSQPYRSADAFILPTPVIFLEYEIFYVRWSQIGMYFYGGENWGLSLMLQPRPFGYKAEDSDDLTGMDTRKSSWEGGLSLAGKNDLGFAEIIYVHDLLNSSNRSLVRAEVGTKIKHENWTFVPSFLMLWFSQGFNEYYYGVREDESTPTRAEYHPNAGLNVAMQSYINYQITPEWGVLGNIRTDYLNSTVTNSPIVSDHYIFSGMISLRYTFDFHSN